MAKLSELYELLVRDIYQALVNQTLVNTVEVQHNVKVRGHSGEEHQIDVYWEYESAGFRHRVCIDAKHHGRPCDKDIVGAFQSKVEDIGKDVKGIIVSLNGFQTGAIALAKAKGIGLQQASWLLREVAIDLTITHDPRSFVRDIRLHLDKDKVRTLLKERGLESFRLTLETDSNNAFLVNLRTGEQVGPWQLTDLRSLSQGTHRVDAGGYGIHSEIGILPLEALELDIMPSADIPIQFSVMTEEDHKAQIEDLIDGWVRTLTVDGRMIDNPGQPVDGTAG